VLATPIFLVGLRARCIDCVAASRSAIFNPARVSAFLCQEWLRVLFLAIIAAAVHAPALQGDRIWDDNYLVHDNPFIKSPLLILETFRHYLFLDSFSAHYRPIQNLSYAVDYFFWNTNTYGYHLTNTLLHAGSGILLYFLLRQLFASLFFRQVSLPARARLQQRLPWISTVAFGIAAVWAVHPVHSAAVDYISGRADSLVFIFSSAGWLLFLRAQRATHPVVYTMFYLLAAISGLLALLSRETACVWIALFLTYVLLGEKQVLVRTRISLVTVISLLLAVYIGFRHLPEQRPAVSHDLRYSAPVRAVLMARALGDYGRLMIFPAHLHMERTVEFDHGGLAGNADWRKAVVTEYLSILGLLFFAVLIFGCLKKGRAQNVRIVGASWFIVGYLPISNIVQLNATAAEHWLYLPSVGLLIFIAGCGFELPKRYRNAVAGCAAIAILSFSVRSFVRSSDWASEEIFYKRTFESGSRSARLALNLAQIYSNRGAYADAERILRLVVGQNPQYPVAQNNLAAVLLHQGKIKDAEKLFAEVEKNAAESRKEFPRTWVAALNLAQLRHNAQDNQSALAILDKARRDYPRVWDLIGLEAEVLRKTNHLDDALPLVEAFVHQNWWHYGAAFALGQLYAQKGDTIRAEAALRHASRLDVHDAKALNLLATIRFGQNQFEDACRIQRRAISRQPDEPRQYILLSNILEKMGRDDEAHAAFAHVSRLRVLVQSEALLN
jgi:tetratricopeptide (TPR) repeat protein